MFGWFRKQSSPSNLEAQVRDTQDRCIAAIRTTWLEMKVKASTPEELARELDVFASSAFRFMFTHFPLTKQAPPSMLWMIIFTAVLESKTHPIDDVNKAIDLLRATYAD